jgi:SAM-dependent methyltransferase
MTAAEAAERWDDGEPLERYVGRWSRLVARELVAWLSVPPASRWLDVGCGTGALTETILRHAAPGAVTGVDLSPGYVAHARAHVTDSRARFEVGDATALPLADASCDAVVSGLLLNFVPAVGRALAEMVRVARGGGTIASYVWDYAGRMELMRHFWDAAAAVDPGARDLDEGRRFPLCRPGPLAELFRGAGLAEVATRAIDVPTVFRDFDDYWSPFLGGQGPAPGYAATLDDERRVALREQIRSRLPVRADGSIHLTARAWAVRGTRLGGSTALERAGSSGSAP